MGKLKEEKSSFFVRLFSKKIPSIIIMVIEMEKKVIFHIDINNAFLSWTAVKMVKEGKEDIRKIPSIIGGDEKERRGIVLAKSPIAKKFNITSISLKAARSRIFIPEMKCFSRKH